MSWFTDLFSKTKKQKTKAQVASDCFNDYQQWFTSLDPTEESVDLTLTVRIRAYGNEAHKQLNWKNSWADARGWANVSAGTNVSSKIPELWMDLRMCKGGLVLPLGVLAHELQHSIHNADKRVIDPDQLINKDVY